MSEVQSALHIRANVNQMNILQARQGANFSMGKRSKGESQFCFPPSGCSFDQLFIKVNPEGRVFIYCSIKKRKVGKKTIWGGAGCYFLLEPTLSIISDCTNYLPPKPTPIVVIRYILNFY